MPPRTTIWALEPHTEGKHLVLRNYMGAWLPIMNRFNGRILFIDAFAGPGKYLGGEDGSPLIALRALTEHNARDRMMNEIVYWFIEKDEKRANHLLGVLEDFRANIPTNCRYHVSNSTFDDTLTGLLDSLEEQKALLAPSFVMIDPFGVSGTPMRTIQRILSNPKSEVYVSFMQRDINRFKDHPNFELHLDDLFGCSEWRNGLSITDSKDRKEFFFNLYKDQLKKAGAKHVLHFALYEGQELIYAIFFGTQDLEGADQMKKAIWKVAPFGDYRFHGGQNLQLTLGDGIVDLTPLSLELRKKFVPVGWVKIENVIDYVKSDETDFHSGHLKMKTLKPMEKEGSIEVKEGTRKSKRGYPDGTILRFV